MNIQNLLGNQRLIRYLIMAVCIVFIELVTFQAVYLLPGHLYILATAVSFIVGVVLNWVIGRLIVFGASHHNPTKEFVMVLIASIVGLLLQMGVVTLGVSAFGLYPLFGKILSIAVSFFWNYWFRATIVYKNHKPLDIEVIEESVV
jgi:putative flippase GtrA